jgi:UDP-N-acetylmuramyl tripeptide synthase
MKISVFFACLVCRLLRAFARLVHRGGTAMPGRIALKLCPGLLGYLASGVETVAITGTNGKTTSARMVEEAFREAGFDYIANRSGANLISGITTEFVLNASLTGKPRKRRAVIECDEAAARRVFGELKPKAVLVTNLFRDQLDRYGEVTHTLENIREGLKKAPDAVLCLNADCSLTSSLSLDLPNRCVFYGVDGTAASGAKKPEISDATHCIRCRTEYEYDYVTYGHLGGFRCPKCGYARHPADVAVTDIAERTADRTSVVMSIRGEKRVVSINLPAIYNVYNAAGAVAAALEMGIPADTAVSALGKFKCGFGRMEKFDIGRAGARMMLVKNPAGCNQVLDFLREISDEFVLVVCLNDRDADGTDISWVWDADFEKLAGLGRRMERAAVSGDRAEDMLLRLKYAGVPEEKLTLEKDYEKLSDFIAAQEKTVFIMPTYTAMLELREHLIKRTGGAEFWE